LRIRQWGLDHSVAERDCGLDSLTGLVSGIDCGVSFAGSDIEGIDFSFEVFIADFNGDDGFLGGDLLFDLLVFELIVDLAGVDMSSGQSASLPKFSLFGDK